MSASVKPRLAGRQPSVRGRGAPGEDPARHTYADSFLDGDVAAERRSVWSAWFAATADAETVLAERDGRLVGFIHVMFDADPRWGSLVDNLHVAQHRRRTGIGSHLLEYAARAVSRRARGGGMYLWVLQQNTAAQRFYHSNGAVHVETAPVPPPGGVPDRLNGTPLGLRMAWPNVTRLLSASGEARCRVARGNLTPGPPQIRLC